MNSIFDNDRLKSFYQLRILSFFFILMIVLLIVGLLFIKKDRIYENNLYFNESDRAYLFVSKDVLSILKKGKKIYIDNVEYDFIIEKIEKKDNNYLVSISFPIELELMTTKYQIKMERENLLNFIIRIIRGE